MFVHSTRRHPPRLCALMDLFTWPVFTSGSDGRRDQLGLSHTLWITLWIVPPFGPGEVAKAGRPGPKLARL